MKFLIVFLWCHHSEATCCQAQTIKYFISIVIGFFMIIVLWMTISRLLRISWFAEKFMKVLSTKWMKDQLYWYHGVVIERKHLTAKWWLHIMIWGEKCRNKASKARSNKTTMASFPNGLEENIPGSEQMGPESIEKSKLHFWLKFHDSHTGLITNAQLCNR